MGEDEVKVEVEVKTKVEVEVKSRSLRHEDLSSSKLWLWPKAKIH
jgi:hypothetical protein